MKTNFRHEIKTHCDFIEQGGNPVTAKCHINVIKEAFKKMEGKTCNLLKKYNDWWNNLICHSYAGLSLSIFLGIISLLVYVALNIGTH